MEKLALLGGEKAVFDVPEELFAWPIVTKEDEDAVLGVLRRGAMSGTDVTVKFEEEFAEWQGTAYALAFCNGTMSLQAAMFAVGLGEGDELICPSKTYWASCIQAFNLGATVVFCDIDENTLCLDPDDLERCISPRTKAIMAVHYLAHPAPMDAVMEIANRHGIKVIEDVSHAQGGLCKGRKLGTFGHVAAMSLMSGKSFAIGEGGMLVTDDKEIYDRALAYAHYERNNEKYISTPELLKYANLPLGGMKGRLNQTCSAMGRVQLKYYDARCAEIRKAMNYFWDSLEGLPGIRAHRVNEAEGSNMAGWYAAHGIYKPEELNGLSVTRFCEALKAEGVGTYPYGNYPLHTHRVFYDFNLAHTEKPTRIAHTDRDVRLLDRDLPVTERVQIFAVPWFKKFMPEHIDKYVHAFKKVVLNSKALLEGAAPEEKTGGRWYFYSDDK
jgi:perosamine synthetase